MILQWSKKIPFILFCILLIFFHSACNNVNDQYSASHSSAGTDYCDVPPLLIEDLEGKPEQFFLTFARDYSICCGTMNFRSANDLSDANKFLLFYFFQDYIDRQKGTPYQLEANYFSEKENAVVLPVSTVKQWLKIYLGTDSFDPASAVLEDGSLTYDSETDTLIVPMLSGFGGVRACGLLKTNTSDEILTMDIGFYNPETFNQNPPEFDCYEYVQMQVKLSQNNPYEFQLLSWVTTRYNQDGTISILDSPQDA